MKKQSLIKTFFDAALAPLRVVLNQDLVRKLGLSALADDRMRAAWPLLSGRLLDVACGYNELVKAYGNGVGLDVFPYPGVDVVSDAALLPFGDCVFDTVTMLACLNHLVHRDRAMAEAFRVLRPGGRVVLTMITPMIGVAAHTLNRGWDWDRNVRGMKPEEKPGLYIKDVISLLQSAGFVLETHRKFQYGLNHLITAKKPDS